MTTDELSWAVIKIIYGLVAGRYLWMLLFPALDKLLLELLLINGKRQRRKKLMKT